MAATSSPVVLVRHARNMVYGVPARQLRTFDDGTALVRFAAGNFRIVPLELLKPATKAQAEEFDAPSAAAGDRSANRAQHIPWQSSEDAVRSQTCLATKSA